MRSNEILEVFGIHSHLPSKVLRNDREILDFIKICISMQRAVREETTWIPCSVRLPEEGQKVLAYMEENGSLVPHILWFGDFSGWESECMVYGCTDRPEAWMPLPKPYEESEDEI